MAVTRTGGASSIFGSSNANPSSLAFTLPGGSDYLVLMVSCFTSSTMTAATWKPDSGNAGADQSMTKIYPTDGSSARVHIWGLASPSATVSASAISFSLSNTTKRVAGCHALSGVGSVGSPVGTTGSDDLSVDVPSETDAIVLDVVYGTNSTGTYTAGANQTERWDAGTSGGVNNHRGGGSQEAGAAGDITMSWTTPTTTTALAGVSFNPPAAPADLDRTADETFSPSDSVTGEVGVARSADDTLSFSESVSGVLDASRTSTDTLSLSEAVTGQLELFLAADDTLSLSESVSAITGPVRTVEDSLTLSEAVSGQLELFRTAADTLGLTEDVDGTVALQRAVTDSLTLTEDVAGEASSPVVERTATDSLTLSESVTADRAVFVTATDTLSSSDSIVRTGTFGRRATDSVYTSEELTHDAGIPQEGEPGYFNPAVTGGVDVELWFGGNNIIHDALFAASRFTAAANGNPGSTVVRIRDRGHDHGFAVGKPLRWRINGQNVWDGYISEVHRGYFLLDDKDPDSKVRFFELHGVDRNVLFTKRFLYAKNDPAKAALSAFPPGTTDSEILNHYMHAHLDLSGDGLHDGMIETVGTPSTDSRISGSAGWSWQDLMQLLTRETGAVYYIDPDRNVILTDVDTRDAALAISDAPPDDTGVFYDSFGRVETGGWGNGWTNDSGPGIEASTNDTVGATAGEGTAYIYRSVDAASAGYPVRTVSARFKWPSTLTDTQEEIYLDLAAAGFTPAVAARWQFSGNLHITKFGSPGAGSTTVAIGVPTPDTWATLKMEWNEDDGVVRAKAWTDGTAEPDWQASRAITFFTPATVAVSTFVEAPAKLFRYDDFFYIWGEGFIGCSDLEIERDASKMVNDMLAWGAGQGSTSMVFKRTTDSDSVSDHNRWQSATFNPTVWRQSTINRISRSHVYGSPQSRRGGKDDAVSVRCTVWEHGFRVGQKVRVRSEVFDYTDVLPIRHMEVDFPQGHPRYRLTLSHEIDSPWTAYEWWIPDISIPDFPGYPIPDFDFPIPVLDLWFPPPPMFDPCACADLGLVETFSRDGSTLGTSEFGPLWVSQAQTGAYTADDQAVFPGDLTHTYSVQPIDGLTNPTVEAIEVSMDFEVHAFGSGTGVSADFDISLWLEDPVDGVAGVQLIILDGVFSLHGFGEPSGSVGIGTPSSVGGNTVPLTMKFNYDGALLRAKLWEIGDTEPGWQLTAAGAWPGSVPDELQLHIVGVDPGLDVLVDEIRINADECTTVGSLMGLFGGPCLETFTRDEAGGWGTSEFGPDWETGPSNDLGGFVDDGSGAVGGAAADFNDFAVELPLAFPIEFTAQIYRDGPLTGTPRMEIQLANGFPTETDEYSIYLYDRLFGAAVGNTTETATSQSNLASVTHGVFYNIHALLDATSARANIWLDGGSEPVGWMRTATLTSSSNALPTHLWVRMWPTDSGQTMRVDNIAFISGCEAEDNPCGTAGCSGCLDTMDRTSVSDWGSPGLLCETWQASTDGDHSIGSGTALQTAGGTAPLDWVDASGVWTGSAFSFLAKCQITGSGRKVFQAYRSTGSTDSTGPIAATDTSIACSYNWYVSITSGTFRVGVLASNSSLSASQGQIDTGYSATGWFWVRGEIDDTTIRIKAWPEGDAEPGSFQASATSGNASLRFLNDPQAITTTDVFGVRSLFGTTGTIEIASIEALSGMNCDIAQSSDPDAISEGQVCETATQVPAEIGYDFHVNSAFVPRTARVWLNRNLLRRDSDYTEDPSAGVISVSPTLIDDIVGVPVVYVCYYATVVGT